MSRVLMNAAVTLALLTTTSAWSEEVEVLSDTAPIKVRDRVVGHVAKGDQFKVLQRSSGWVAIEFSSDQGPQRGWVLSNHLMTLIEESSPAPDEPTFLVAGVDLELDFVQIASQGPDGSLTMRAVLRNRGDSDVAYDVEDFRLSVDGQQVEPVSSQASPRSYMDRVYTAFGNGGQMRSRVLNAPDFLDSGELPAGGAVQGWLRFPLLGVRRDTDLSNVSYRLQGKLGEQDFDVDLRSRAVRRMNAQRRSSNLDDTVPVIELQGSLNALSFPAFKEVLGQRNQDVAQAVVKMHGDSSILDPYVLNQLGSGRFSRPQPAKSHIVFVIDSDQRQSGAYSAASQNLMIAESEAEATILVLAQRENAANLLVAYLSHPESEVRAAAASGLARFAQNEKVTAALVDAAKDEDRQVRAAAAHALGGYDWAIRPLSISYGGQRLPAAPATQPVVSALTTALSDSDNVVRLHATRAAGRVNNPELVQGLIKRLMDEELGIVAAACSSLGDLKAEAAVDALQELRKSANRSHRAAAIRALGQIGTLSPVDTVIAQLKEGSPSYCDFETLEKAGDRRAVQPLIDYVAGPEGAQHYADRAAKTLGLLGDQRATESLLKRLRYGNNYSGEVPQALGRLGDPKAIEPLRQAAAVSGVNPSRKAAIYQALVRLEADGVLEQLAGWLDNPQASGMSSSQLLTAIGISNSAQATDLLAPYLDDSSTLHIAAGGLIQQDSPEAVAAMEERLMDEDYPLGSGLLSALYSKRTEQSVALIRGAAKSSNASTRRAAANYIRAMDGRSSDRDRVHRSLIGKPYTISNVDHWINGDAPSDAELNNKVILLDFWAVWCGPCIATFPELRRWHEEYADDGLEIIGVTRYYGYGWDDESLRPVRLEEESKSVERNALKQFAQHHELKHRLAVLPSDSTMSRDYGVTGIPQAVLIDRAGKIRLIKVGSGKKNAEAMEEMILRCLKTLDFSGQSLTDDDLKERLEQAGEFTRLNLQGTKVTAEGLQALADLDNLEQLDLEGTSIGNDALDVVSEITALKSIGLTATNVTPEAVEQLQEARPELKVRIDQWSPWLTREGYQEYFETMLVQGVFPLEVQGKSTKEGDRYRARFMPKPPDRELQFQSMHAASYATLRQREAEAVSSGKHAVSLTSFEDAEGMRRYNGTWVEGPDESYWSTPLIAAVDARQEALRHRARGDLEAAAAACRRAIEAKPDFLLGHATLGYTLLAMNHDEAAKKPFGEVARLIQQIPEDERHGSDWEFLGHALYRLGNWKESRAAIQRGMEIRGEKEPTVKAGTSWLYLAMTLHRLREESQSREIFLKLVEEAGEDGFSGQPRLREEAAKLLGVDE